MKLEELLKKGYATVYIQCSQEVCNKLENTDDWEKAQKEQSPHDLIQKIERICVGLDNHKQEVFNLVQSLKTLFLYSQREKDTGKEYGQNFKSLWKTVKAFGGSPGLHKGMIDAYAKDAMRVADAANLTKGKLAKIEEDASKAIKAALLISGADKCQFRKLKDKLINNYLLGTDQYPDTSKKVLQILGNNQMTRSSLLYKTSPNNTGVAFLQRGSQGGQRGCVGRGGRGEKSKGSREADPGMAAMDDVSTMTGRTGAEDGPRTNSRGESHCFHCGGAKATGHTSAPN